MHFTKIFSIEGLSIPVFHHRVQSQTFYVNGTVTYKNALLWSVDPKCKGEGLYIQGEFVPKSFQEINLKVQTRNVKITQYKDGCFFEDEYIGQKCLQDYIRVGEERIVVPKLDSSDKKYHLKYRTLDVNTDSVHLG